MRGFRSRGADLVADFEPAELELLDTLAGQVAGLLEQPDDTDPAVARLLPDAYRGDAEAAAEFRRFTATELAERKVGNATSITEVVARTRESVPNRSGAKRVALGPSEVQAWLRSLTDIRLTIAVRLGIETDDDLDTLRASSTHDQMVDIYDWLGFVQESLVGALDRS